MFLSSPHLEPQTVQPFISAQSNNSITVAWSAPNGNVDQYLVNLNSSNSRNYSSPPLNSTNTSYMFPDLAAGKIYKATVISKSGNFREESQPVTNATCEH